MMGDRGDTSYRYVNLERRWPACTLAGVEMRDGVLRLASLPSGAVATGSALGDASALAGPSRIGVAGDGTIYVADPARNCIERMEPCASESTTLPCLTGPGSDPGQLREPHGVAVGPNDALYIADTGNARVQLIDRVTGQLRAVIGARHPWSPPSPSDADGELRAPYDLALDRDGNLYVAEPRVVDAGGAVHPGRIQKFDRQGRPVPAFWATVRAERAPSSPMSIVIVSDDGVAGASAAPRELLLVVDGDPAAVLVFALDGHVDAAATARWTAFAAHVTSPTATAAGGGFLYVADDDSARVLVFTTHGDFVGVARDYSSATLALGIDHDGRLLAQPRAGGALARFDATSSLVELGTVIAGPFTHEPGQEHWFHARLTVDALPAECHVQLFTYTAAAIPAGGAPDAPITTAGCLTPRVDAADAPAPTGVGRWRAAPVSATSALILNAAATYLWVAIVLHGNGRATPEISQLRLDDDSASWLRHLPAIYRRDDATRTFLDRALAVFQDEQTSIEDDLDRIIAQLDPYAASDARLRGRSWLDWLSSWLAFDLAGSWSEAQRRDTLGQAFALEASRGTVGSLRTFIRLYAGADVRIGEPAVASHVWALGTSARLGIDTMVAAAAPLGAVVDTTAALDRSYLLAAEDDGSPAFARLANRFCVEAYAADFPTADARRELTRVIDAEKPAHACYHLCLIEPAMRVGAQARLGIDAIVGGTPGVCLTNDAVLDDRAVLTRSPTALQAAVVGATARLGHRAILT